MVLFLKQAPLVRAMRRTRGFTLIELIAVIVVTSIMAAVAAPSLRSMGSSRASMAAKQLLRDLTYARQRAVAGGSTTWVVFNVGAKTWSVLEENPSSPGRVGAAVVTDPATNAPFVQTMGVGAYTGVSIISATFDAGAEIGFNWMGEPFNAAQTALTAQGTVTLTGGYVVNVAKTTGFATYVAP